MARCGGQAAGCKREREDTVDDAGDRRPRRDQATAMRVVDLSTGIAGGYCAKLLADAGADVVKLEPPGGDPLRLRSASGSAVDPVAGAPLFQYLHAGSAAPSPI